MIIPATSFGHYGFGGTCPAPATVRDKSGRCCLAPKLSSTGALACCAGTQDTVLQVAGGNKYKLTCKTAGTPPPPPPPPDNGGTTGGTTPVDGQGGGGTYVSTSGGGGLTGDSGTTVGDALSSLTDFLTSGYTPWIIGGLVAIYLISSSKKPASGGGSTISISPAPPAPAPAAAAAK